MTAWRAIRDEINGGVAGRGRYLLAVSGGVDSMFLAEFFHRNCRLPFRVAHFDHALRPASIAEREMVAAWCADRGVAFLTARGDPQAMRDAPSLEAEARVQRYAFMEGVRHPDEMLVTAHHANDQLETVLMRLMRGYPDTNLRMLRVDADRYKPLLSVPKETILAQARARGVRWMEDESNASLDMERNWVRNSLVPQMMERRNVLRTIGMSDGHAPEKLLTDGAARATPETQAPKRFD